MEVAHALKGKKLIQVKKIGKGELTFNKVDFFALYKIKILHLSRDKIAVGKFRAKIYGFPANQPNSKDKYTTSKAKDSNQTSGRRRTSRWKKRMIPGTFS